MNTFFRFDLCVCLRGEICETRFNLYHNRHVIAFIFPSSSTSGRADKNDLNLIRSKRIAN